MKKTAIIGSGITGNSAAWALSKTHDVTLYEKRARLGGHAATMSIDYNGTPIDVDTGFIVYNELNYPNLIKLFECLDVETIKSKMSFAFSMDEGALEWSGKSLDHVFTQRKNIVSPRFWRMIKDILRFNKTARADLAQGIKDEQSLGAYLKEKGFSKNFLDYYLLPMGAAIWSTKDQKMLEFPAKSFLQFFDNHRLIDKERPQWRTVKGGSKHYVEKLLKDTKATIFEDCPVRKVQRTEQGVEIISKKGKKLYDDVVFATHTDQALEIIDNPTTQEKTLLSAIHYAPNDVWLHCDKRLMPKREKVWSAWNYMASTKPKLQKRLNEVTVSYSMNILQNIDAKYPLFVTLNPPFEPDKEKTFGRYTYDHPQYDKGALKAQKDLPLIQGKDRLWFCGAWAGYGFHEDGLRAGLDVARQLGGTVPWSAR